MQRLILTALFIMALSGCVSAVKMDERMQPWQTASLKQILDAWGPPTREQTVGERIFLIWNDESHDSGVNIGISVGGAIGRNAGIGVSTLIPGSNEQSVCSRVVEIDSEQTVYSVKWNGEPSTCFDVTPARKTPAEVN